MKRGLKITLITMLSIVILLALAGIGGWIYIKSVYLNFENDYAENFDINEVTIDGYTFRDLNGNKMLDIYEDDRRSIEERADNLLSQMSQDEKIHLLKGSGMGSGLGMNQDGTGIPGAVGTIVPTPRLGIPTVFLSDGPAGLRIEPTRENDNGTYYCTALPIGTLLASSWNVDLMEEVGSAMGKEALEYGIDVILGPGANIHRHPLCGRNFEYYSEDPVLTGWIGVGMVNGIESNGVGTSVKHFVANNQETSRMDNDVIVSERAMREIYLKGFEIIVKESQPWTIMSSYNKVNGTYTSESKYLLTDILRDEWGFEGLVMTDWFGGKNVAAQIAAGNDLIEPGSKEQWDVLVEAAEKGTLTGQEIDTSAKRILKLILKSGKMESNQYGNDPDLEKHAQIARRSATEGIVLLKNKNTLPLQPSQKVALIGTTSYDFIAGGTGSGDVNEAYTVSLEQGLENAGFEINEVAKNAFEQLREAHKEAFVKPEGFYAMFEPYDPPEMTLSADFLKDCASSADVAVITIGRNSGEGGDRVEKNDFLLSQKELELIDSTTEAFHKAGKKVIVVLNVGGVIETASWKGLPDAVLLVWQGGQEGGNSVADILSGAVNPSGKLPMTFPIHLKDHASNANFPLDGEPFDWKSTIFREKDKPEEELIKNKDFTRYEEGIYVGYRHFDKADLAVSYPFGYGLSYTQFEQNQMGIDMTNDSIHVNVSVKNTGERAGKEVVQLYVSKPESAIDRPVKELKGFLKTKILQPQDSVNVVVSIPVSELRYWDEDSAKWVLEKGTYLIQSGASSRDIRQMQSIEL